MNSDKAEALKAVQRRLQNTEKGSQEERTMKKAARELTDGSYVVV